ncbi:MAG: hypothetical protein P4L43_20985 [Syntrophobacteraceae bacterium]|nr:hypothetical protein [Syntrophobacteraceae bacterium]
MAHIKTLKGCGQAIENFTERVVGLGEKLGPVLFQLSPAIKRKVQGQVFQGRVAHVAQEIQRVGETVKGYFLLLRQ